MRFGILVGGGPAPGINGVIGAATIVARRARRGRASASSTASSWLMKGNTDHVRALDDRGRLAHPPARRLDPPDVAREPDEEARASRARRRRARAARHRPPDHDRRRRHRLLRAPRLRGGRGGGSASSTCRRRSTTTCRFRAASPTFGFETARDTRRASSSEPHGDARTTGRWYLVVAMGRTAGHLASASAKAAGATLTLDPGGVPAGKIRLAKLAASSRRARQARGRGERHGVVVLAEGLAATTRGPRGPRGRARDEHGHVRLAEVAVRRVLEGRGDEALHGARPRPHVRRRRTSATSCAAPTRSRSTSSTRATSATARCDVLAGGWAR